MSASTDNHLISALTYPREEIERHLVSYSVRRMPLTSPEWQSLASREAKIRKIRLRYWYNQAFHWGISRQTHKRTVEETYDNIWAGMDFANFTDPNKQLMFHEWGPEGLIMNSSATHRLHQALMIKALRILRPATVLEVGSGNGINLVVMASQCPGIRFEGIELTKNGVEISKALVAGHKLPQSLLSFMAEPPLKPDGFRDVTVNQGSAERLPYADCSFDLVMTRLALEQMESIRDQALAEISRVARSYVLMVESFSEMNDQGLRKQYAVGNRYFRGAIADLPRYGLEPVFTFSAWPHKITMWPIFVLAKKSQATSKI